MPLRLALRKKPSVPHARVKPPELPEALVIVLPDDPDAGAQPLSQPVTELKSGMVSVTADPPRNAGVAVMMTTCAVDPSS